MDIEILKAINAVRSTVGAAHKDAKNPHFKSTYATLNAVMGALEPALKEQGVEITQEVDISMQQWILYTYIAKEDKQYKSPYPLSVKDKSDPQKVLAGITYARRGSLTTIFGMLSEDDDGNKAAQPAPKAAPVDPEKVEWKGVAKEYLSYIKAASNTVDLLNIHSSFEEKLAPYFTKDANRKTWVEGEYKTKKDKLIEHESAIKGE